MLLESAKNELAGRLICLLVVLFVFSCTKNQNNPTGQSIMPSAKSIVEVQNVATDTSITLTYGESYQLPGEVKVLFDNNSTSLVPVIWDSISIPLMPGYYRMYGKLQLPFEITNSNNLMLFWKATILPPVYEICSDSLARNYGLYFSFDSTILNSIYYYVGSGECLSPFGKGGVCQSVIINKFEYGYVIIANDSDEAAAIKFSQNRFDLYSMLDQTIKRQPGEILYFTYMVYRDKEYLIKELAPFSSCADSLQKDSAVFQKQFGTHFCSKVVLGEIFYTYELIRTNYGNVDSLKHLISKCLTKMEEPQFMLDGLSGGWSTTVWNEEGSLAVLAFPLKNVWEEFKIAAPKDKDHGKVYYGVTPFYK